MLRTLLQTALQNRSRTELRTTLQSKTLYLYEKRCQNNNFKQLRPTYDVQRNMYMQDRFAIFSC